MLYELTWLLYESVHNIIVICLDRGLNPNVCGGMSNTLPLGRQVCQHKLYKYTYSKML